ncbi:MAG: hypothetical protein UCO57_09235 [Gemmiger sp.]|uniref:hypothetical protein n=1 Tax=Gemmiger sp. TaxID=2049027 RepID=UPI002E7851A2|nr:hypothetical protein [Gemmiger sp.]MEE0708946.1 hypothetical protein [Gemmiger sp.]
MKRVVSIVLFLVLAFSCATNVMAEISTENTPTPLYTGIAICYADLSSNGNQMNLTGGITTWDGYTSKLTIFFQERDGYSGNWYTKSTYVATGSATQICAIDTNITATPGHSYRGYCIFRAFDGSGNMVDEEYAYTTILFM